MKVASRALKPRFIYYLYSIMLARAGAMLDTSRPGSRGLWRTGNYPLERVSLLGPQ
jgi:hypothetical protein